MITPLDQPIDPLDNMTDEEIKALEEWEEHFQVFGFLLYASIDCAGQVYCCRSLG